MKKLKNTKKGLTFNKKTIANLDNIQMDGVIGKDAAQDPNKSIRVLACLSKNYFQSCNCRDEAIQI